MSTKTFKLDRDKEGDWEIVGTDVTLCDSGITRVLRISKHAVSFRVSLSKGWSALARQLLLVKRDEEWLVLWYDGIKWRDADVVEENIRFFKKYLNLKWGRVYYASVQYLGVTEDEAI